MTFRLRIAISAAAAVALTVVLASILVYVVARGQLRAPVDSALESRAADISRQPLGVIQTHDGDTYLAGIRPEFGEAGGYVQLVRGNGSVLVPPGQGVRLPVDDEVRAVAGKDGEQFWKDVNVDGTHLRMFTFPYGPSAAVQVARPLTEVDQSLHRIGLFLVLIAAGGVVIAAALGLVVARAALVPVQRLTSTVERVSETQDLSERIDVEGHDELSRLAASFNTMFAALEESTRAQRQLVADASHELRTPLTSVRTNIEVLADDRDAATRRAGAAALGRRRAARRDDDPDLGADRARARRAIDSRARGRPARPARPRCRRSRAQESAGDRRTRPSSSRPTVHGVPSTIERAVSNLLDNAAKWSPSGAGVEVGVREGTLVVRDHGPGSRTRISRTSSTASIAPAPRAGCRARGSGSRS